MAHVQSRAIGLACQLPLASSDMGLAFNVNDREHLDPGQHTRILHEIMTVPQNTHVSMNNVMEFLTIK